jgi:preprotein translocase subunit SecF
MQIFKNTHYNFLRWRWHAIALSTLVVLGGIAVAYSRGGLALGIDFAGGTNVIVKFEQPVSEDRVRAALEKIPGDKAVQQYGDPAGNEILIKLPQIEGAEQGTSLEQGGQQAIEALRAAGLPKFEVISTEIVGPVIGADLQRKGIYATLASLLAITAYIAFRFRPSFALGSVIATLHDILVTFAFLIYFNYELSLNIVAALLTMVGYSVNDMIVIFDRVRENMRSQRRESLDKVVNDGVNQTLARTVITSGTVFLSVLALYLFGGEVLEGFAFTLLVGTLATTYSGWFIAPSIAIMLSERKKTVAEPAAAGGAVVTQPGRRPPKSQRKARAS